MAVLALLAVRIRASRQLSGAISNLNCVASSILPDYDATTGLWDGRAGGWSYDYDNQGAGASLYGLDAANVHTTAATTDKEFIALLRSEKACPRGSYSGRNWIRRTIADLAEPSTTGWQIVGIRFLTFRRQRRAGPASETRQQRQTAGPSVRIADALESNCAVESFFPLLRSFLLGNRCTSRKRRECDYSNGGTSINSHV